MALCVLLVYFLVRLMLLLVPRVATATHNLLAWLHPPLLRGPMRAVWRCTTAQCVVRYVAARDSPACPLGRGSAYCKGSKRCENRILLELKRSVILHVQAMLLLPISAGVPAHVCGLWGVDDLPSSLWHSIKACMSCPCRVPAGHPLPTLQHPQQTA